MRKKLRPVSNINVTPMVDVMLVLLIVFMVTAPLLTVGVPVNLPKVEANSLDAQKEPLEISINQENEIYLGEEQIPFDDLIAKDAAEAMKVDASSLQNLGLVDQVIKEPLGGAHRDLRGVSNSISQVIEEKLLTFDEIDISDLLDKRYEKIMSYGSI
ncbi:MAG: hypothetical protein CBD82_04570 [Gammaproteobacteria bacterium TMED222]|nr:MAG: hypothetical protein CBD82_04570 [Gammaproteobacteria bacterium TMED222]